MRRRLAHQFWRADAFRAELQRLVEWPAASARGIDAGLLAPTIQRLAASPCLASGAFCYIETARRQPLPALPPGWQPYREGTAGEVGYHLLRIHPPSTP